MPKTTVGGQGVLEGVMMRSVTHSALAVRKESGEVVTKEWDNKVRTSKAAKWPVVRGVVNFIDMLVMGVSTITDSAKLFDESSDEDFKPSKFEEFVAKKTGKNAMDVMMVFAVIVGLAIAVGLFFILPTVITNWIKGSIENSLIINLIDGLVRIVIFLSYLMLVRCLKDIKRVFSYHGAEHKTINCYEHDHELTVENVKKESRLHPRCGTSYLLFIMIVTIIIYSFLGWSGNPFLRFGIRLLLLPFIAGLSYEFLKLAAKSESLFFRIIRWPGMQLQRLTTAEPDDSMIECAILAFRMADKQGTPEELEALRRSFDRRKQDDTAAAAAFAAGAHVHEDIEHLEEDEEEDIHHEPEDHGESSESDALAEKAAFSPTSAAVSTAELLDALRDGAASTAQAPQTAHAESNLTENVTQTAHAESDLTENVTQAACDEAVSTDGMPEDDDFSTLDEHIEPHAEHEHHMHHDDELPKPFHDIGTGALGE